ncbi:hypothetical protein NDN08_004923 [Rhodosorus marinus]|uniref:Thioesterase domain-containing protein n=1 Tax=Rhodosorus marinus TaxID=101924 RepID=A0AAV8UHR5_9RHOD|nr:hypothetical protein NDN08_004923 [Rhodosorus marinus]
MKEEDSEWFSRAVSARDGTEAPEVIALIEGMDAAKDNFLFDAVETVGFAMLTSERLLWGVRVGDNLQGFKGFIHGGIIATLMDQSMGNLLFLLLRTGYFAKEYGEKALPTTKKSLNFATLSLNIKYFRPARVNSLLLFDSIVTDVQPKRVALKTQLFDENDVLQSESEVVFARKNWNPKL